VTAGTLDSRSGTKLFDSAGGFANVTANGDGTGKAGIGLLQQKLYVGLVLLY
jgi:hypothetical protein